MGYCSESEAKAAILEIGRRMYQKDMVAANDGNISVKVGPDEIWATPTGVSKGFMTEDMLVKINSRGEVLAGSWKTTSEIKMHLRVYAENPQVKAVTHAHPLTATAFAIAGTPLDQPILAESVVQLGCVPVAPYATPGTQEVPDSIAPYCRDYNGVLLANHGVLTWGESPMQAFYRLESIEYYAKITVMTQQVLGSDKKLTNEQIVALLETRKKLGILTGGLPAGYEG